MRPVANTFIIGVKPLVLILVYTAKPGAIPPLEKIVATLVLIYMTVTYVVFTSISNGLMYVSAKRVSNGAVSRSPHWRFVI